MRRRLLVALLLPEPVAAEVQGLRRALSDPSLDRIAPHITLVPPVNVNESNLGRALDHARRVAASGRTVHLTIGAVAKFEHENPVTYLSVTGADLAPLQEALFVEPLHETQPHAFVPHVTIARGHVNTVSIDYSYDVEIDRLYVLESDERRVWRAIADFPFRAPATVGRGGVEIEFTTTKLVDPVSATLLARTPDKSDLVVVARCDDKSVGLATSHSDGTRIVLDAFIVRQDQRGTGIAQKLLEQFVYACRLAGANEVVSRCEPSAPFLLQHGFESGSNSRPTLFLNPD